MPYTKVHDPWKDYPDTSTPLTAAALDTFEDGIDDAVAAAEAATADAAAATAAAAGAVTAANAATAAAGAATSVAADALAAAGVAVNAANAATADAAAATAMAAAATAQVGAATAAAAAATAAVNAHTAASSNAHPASAISILDTAADFDATNVEDALAELQTAIEAFTGGGGGPWSIVFTSLCAELPATAYAQHDLQGTHAVLRFDPSTDESAMFTGRLPTSYAGGGVQVRLVWAAVSGTAGDVIWETSFERVAAQAGGQDIDSDGFATAVTASAAATATAGVTVATTIVHTDGAQMDSLAAGDLFRLKINRDANNGSDTMAGDASLLLVSIVED